MNSTSRFGMPSYLDIPISPQPIVPSGFRKSWVYPTRNTSLIRGFAPSAVVNRHFDPVEKPLHSPVLRSLPTAHYLAGRAETRPIVAGRRAPPAPEHPAKAGSQ